MEPKIVEGEYAKHDVMVYALSTCMWCKRLKSKLMDNNIKYSYIDVDLAPYVEKQKLKQHLQNFKPRLAFPMMFVDGDFIPNMEIDAEIEELRKDG